MKGYTILQADIMQNCNDTIVTYAELFQPNIVHVKNKPICLFTWGHDYGSRQQIVGVWRQYFAKSVVDIVCSYNLTLSQMLFDSIQCGFLSTCVTGRQGCLVPLGIWSNFWYMFCNLTYEIDYCALALSFWCTYDMCGIIVNLFKFVWNKDHIPILKSCIITFEYCLLKQIRSQSVDYVST